MCGIAGYSLSSESRVERRLAAQSLLAAIAERGSDASGFAYRGPFLDLVVRKRRGGASGLLEAVEVPEAANQALLHVRAYTKGHPSLEANNHPIRHGAVVGIHNGVVTNDEEIFARHGFERAEPGMTVDSEAIFALLDRFGSKAAALDGLRGAMAAAWVDARCPDVLFVARGVGRPLWIGEGKHELLFASTREGLEVAERFVSVRLRKRALTEGSLLAVVDGRPVWMEAFEPDRSYVVAPAAPSVAASEERSFCLARLAAIAALGA